MRTPTPSPDRVRDLEKGKVDMPSAERSLIYPVVVYVG